MNENFAPKKLYHEILETCASIAKDRQAQYGEAGESLRIAKNIAYDLFGIELTVEQFAQVMVALKLSRQKFGFKKDNVIDAINYLAISLNEHGN